MAAHEQYSDNDEWYTPKYIFDALGCRFDLDAAAPLDRTFCHVPADHFLTSMGLEFPWNGFVWVNPPFSGRNSKQAWINKMILYGNGIILTPDRSSTSWWQSAARSADVLLFIEGKVKFIKPDGTIGKQPSTGTTLFGYGEKAVAALIKARNKKLGVLLQKK